MTATEDIGLTLAATSLIIYSARDFSWSFQLQDTSGNAINFPAVDLFIELAVDGHSHNTPSDITPPTGVSIWGFIIAGSGATCQVPNAIASLIPNGTAYQLAQLPSGTTYPGGYAIRQGTVEVVS